MALSKIDIISEVCDKTNLNKKQSSEMVEKIIEIIKITLEAGDDIMISGFGKFFVRNKNQRNGRNPATGEEMLLEARKVVCFHTSEKLKTLLNKRWKLIDMK